MLAAYFLGTLDGIGGTDLFATGVALNNLQTYQDTVVGYGDTRKGAWAARVSYSPNAGVAERISPARSVATSVPASTPQIGQILGGATSGAENNDGRGKTWGAMLAYLGDDPKPLAAAYNRNDLSGATPGAPSALGPGGFLKPMFATEDFTSYMLAAKYRFGFGTELGGSFYQGQLEEAGQLDPKMRVLAVAAKHIDRFAGPDRPGHAGQVHELHEGQEHRLHARRRLQPVQAHRDLRSRRPRRRRPWPARAVRLGGHPRRRNGSAEPAGGPVSLLVPLGSTEVPLFSGANLNIDADTKMVGIGIRHSF
ncbi:MAG: hypothetical protein MZW92_56910 [Comamonadaceae bacterium]|nr:hypothetical protein [Comamonadaceae bacterium]